MPCDTKNSDVPEKLGGGDPQRENGLAQIVPSGFPGRWIPGPDDATRRGVGLGDKCPRGSRTPTTKVNKVREEPGGLREKPRRKD